MVLGKHNQCAVFKEEPRLHVLIKLILFVTTTT